AALALTLDHLGKLVVRRDILFLGTRHGRFRRRRVRGRSRFVDRLSLGSGDGQLRALGVEAQPVDGFGYGEAALLERGLDRRYGIAPRLGPVGLALVDPPEETNDNVG